jgi:hypothetical protein
MSKDTLNSQKRSQGDFAGRLGMDDYFADVTVLEQNKGATEDDVLQALSTLNEKVGKNGACVVVLMPELLPATPDVPGPEYRVRVTVQVIVQPLFNDGDSGTGKSAEQIARRVRQLLHNYDGGWGTWTFAGMDPLPVTEGQVSYGVAFTRTGRHPRQVKLSLPMGDPDEAAVPCAVTLEGPAGADLYYTTDGTYPTPGAAGTTLYSSAIAIAEPTTLRVVAYRAGSQPSNALTLEYGSNFEFSNEFSDEFS